MQNKTCETCIFFDDREVKKMKTKVLCFVGDGLCVKNSPTDEGFPVVFYDSWCGEYKAEDQQGCTTCDARHCCPEGEKAVDAGKPRELDGDELTRIADKLMTVLVLAPKVVLNDEDYWRGFNNGICRSLIELGVDHDYIGKLIR